MARQKNNVRKGGANSTILVGPLPPPTIGQSISFEMLRDEFIARSLPHLATGYQWWRDKPT